jgi:phosphate:Na+ symporter
MQPGANLNLIDVVGLVVGGLALFLLGLELMTGGLKAIAGSRLQALLGTLTANRFRGVLAGAGITALIMSANIGSTLTAQIIAFNISAITPFLLAGGFLLYGFSRRQLVRELGGVLLGPRLLFLAVIFRLANDMIEHFNEVGRLTHANVRAVDH